jgi:hypothetical protein
MKTFTALFVIISGLLVAYYYVQTHGLPAGLNAGVAGVSPAQSASADTATDKDKTSSAEQGKENRDSDESDSEEPFEFEKKDINKAGGGMENSAVSAVKNPENTADGKSAGKPESSVKKSVLAKKARSKRKAARLAARQEALAQSLLEYKNKKHISRLTKDKKGEDIIPAVAKIITEAGFSAEGIDLTLNEDGNGFVSSSTWKYAPAADK